MVAAGGRCPVGATSGRPALEADVLLASAIALDSLQDFCFAKTFEVSPCQIHPVNEKEATAKRGAFHKAGFTYRNLVGRWLAAAENKRYMQIKRREIPPALQQK